MEIFRHRKIERVEIVAQHELKHGLIVWVPTALGDREERVFVLDGKVEKLMTLPEFANHKKQIAESNRLKNLGRFHRRKKETLARHGILSDGLMGEPA